MRRLQPGGTASKIFRPLADGDLGAGSAHGTHYAKTKPNRGLCRVATLVTRPAPYINPQRSPPMLGYALLFLVIALIAAALGFGGIAGVAGTIAKVLFFVFLVLFIVALVTGRRGPPSV